METIERRSESPAPRTRSSSRLSNLSNQELSSGDAEVKDPAPKKKSASSKRKNRGSDKENGEVDSTNGDIIAREGTPASKVDSSDCSEVKESDSINNIDGSDGNNGETEKCPDIIVTQEEEHLDNGHCSDREPQVEVELVNGDSAEEIASEKEEVRSKDGGNDSVGMDTEESYYTAETENSPSEVVNVSPAEDLNLKLDQEEECERNSLTGRTNGFNNGHDFEEYGKKIDKTSSEEDIDSNQEPKKGFLSKWSFRLTTEKKDLESNSPSAAPPLYFSSIKGRVPLRNNKCKAGENQEVYRRAVKTPNTTLNLDDSFRVRSEPSRSNRNEIKDKPNLRKYPAKRCLNNDEETEDRDDGFLSNLAANKRRKLDEESRTGFLKNLLWSPFRKRSDSEDSGSSTTNSDDPAGNESKSWFRSPFWFWKKGTREEQKN